MGTDDTRKQIKRLWKKHHEIQEEIESLECQLAIELEKAEWKDSNEDRKGWYFGKTHKV